MALHSSPLLQRVLGDGAGGRLSPQALWAALASGVLLAALTIAECASFSLLMATGTGGVGLGQIYFSTLVGLAAGSLFVALRTALPPNGGGPDSATVAVSSALIANVAAVAALKGYGPEQTKTVVLITFPLVAIMVGLLLSLLGYLRLANIVRFLPYPVINGFVAAAGVLLLIGGLKVVLGKPINWADVGGFIAAADYGRLLVAAGFALTLLLAVKRSASPFAVPVVTVISIIAVNLALALLSGRMDRAAWFAGAVAKPEAWSPLTLDFGLIDWGLLRTVLPEALAVSIVLLAQVLGKVSSIEALDGQSCDLNGEMRMVGQANLMFLPLGTTPVNLWGPSSRILLQASGGQRLSGAVIAAVTLLALWTKIDMLVLLPRPILGGILLFGGYSVLNGALRRALTQRAWRDLALLTAVSLICLNSGFVAGVSCGLIAACIGFAVSYGRVGVVRRHLTRAETASGVDHGPDAMQALRQSGEAIHVFSLAGYLFFGSADALYETLRRTIEGAQLSPVRWIVLDCAKVTGADASAIMSFVKLKTLASKRGVALILTGLNARLRAMLEQDGVVSAAGPHRAVTLRSDGMVLAERELLVSSNAMLAPPPLAAFESWLGRELEVADPIPLIARYFMRREFGPGSQVYRQGDRANAIDLVACGTIAVAVAAGGQDARALRRMGERTIIGEMGFFRDGVRSAHVTAETAATLYTLTRESFDRLQAENPAAAMAVMTFVVRVLAERLAFANAEIAALA